ncbi:hypothetical protein PF005_g5418 [Phytophthora fragariae]|uniref:Secreted protein n=1 Tax=Phytophthora fragariae TaxID=53985 RepID=A0A6A3T191_9STRA|nr:hypothetical protein PF003_g22387 [Phytophthora fragariae]KAE8944582.1 hypothetical protein PF009_g5729 [Phytophthora fragariae]KAE9023174.1 hypothetical protein PF011_g4114 [Phytophthora fragariae]KAE9127768.1 hypothetical protein PF007_g5496 [Phytophthora fragariae]KAE9128234.1 hypothetical protein PF010_g4572 [Phytophthora fragariae]
MHCYSFPVCLLGWLSAACEPVWHFTTIGIAASAVNPSTTTKATLSTTLGPLVAWSLFHLEQQNSNVAVEKDAGPTPACAR